MKNRHVHSLQVENNPARFYVVGLANNRRLLQLMLYLELSFFPPATPENSKFNAVLTRWNKSRVLILSVPDTDKSKVLHEAKVKSVDLRPGTLLGSGDQALFPLVGDNVFIARN